jgi:glycine/D-amino acid oxidase-like deaminating enzyme
VAIPANNLYPLKLVTELFGIAKNASTDLKLNLHTHTPVTSLSRPENATDARHRWVLHTPRGDVKCNYVIHATNAYANHLIPPSNSPSGVAITPTRGQVQALRAGVDATKLTKNSWVGNDGFEYWFPRPVKKTSEHPVVIVGGGREASSAYEHGTTDDSELEKDVSRVLKDFLPSLYSEKLDGEDVYVKGREPECEWVRSFPNLRYSQG